MIKTCKRQHTWDNETHKTCSTCRDKRSAEWKVKNPIARKKYSLAWRNTNKEKAIASQRKSRYGITAEDYNTLSKLQNGKCAICKIADLKDIDHCHLSNKVRGLLCHPCNLLLGNAKDNPEILRNAADYLESRS